jgi:GNS1/SUR4 family
LTCLRQHTPPMIGSSSPLVSDSSRKSIIGTHLSAPHDGPPLIQTLAPCIHLHRSELLTLYPCIIHNTPQHRLMCAPTTCDEGSSRSPLRVQDKVPIERILDPPSALARATCVSILVGVFAIWGKFTFIDEQDVPGGRKPIHSGLVPLGMTVFYLVSLPLLRMFTNRYLKTVDVKLMLRESMILYNAAQVLLNGWMVYRIVDALAFRGHPFIAGPIHKVDTGAAFAVWVHYCDKYLEYLDTYFMVLRGKLDQVRSF